MRRSQFDRSPARRIRSCGPLTRRIRRPIFVFAFQRGGSTLLLDLLLSHPDVCRTAGELQMVFRGRGRHSLARRAARRLATEGPLWLLTRSRFFDPTDLRPRPRLGRAAAWWIDRTLYRSRFGVEQPLAPGIAYERAELSRCRLASKGVGGTVFTAEPLLELYADATVFLLVRNGLAVCEGRVRRGFDVADVAREYAAVATEMARLDRANGRCRLLRYEDLVADPRGMLEVMYEHAELSMVQQVRLRRQPTPSGRGMRWFDLSDLPEQVTDRDSAQIGALAAEHRRRFFDIGGTAMRELGYQT